MGGVADEERPARRGTGPPARPVSGTARCARCADRGRRRRRPAGSPRRAARDRGRRARVVAGQGRAVDPAVAPAGGQEQAGRPGVVTTYSAYRRSPSSGHSGARNDHLHAAVGAVALVHLDAEHAADRAVRAVGGDEVATLARCARSPAASRSVTRARRRARCRRDELRCRARIGRRQASATWRRSTASSQSCGTVPGAHGLTTAACCAARVAHRVGAALGGARRAWRTPTATRRHRRRRRGPPPRGPRRAAAPSSGC